MSERESLLAAVVADPDNDLPRLVFADWLEENGDPDRAEFIRSQVGYARVQSSDLPRRIALLPRAAELYARERLRWVGELPTPKGVQWVDREGRELGFPAFDRGFASHLRVGSDKVLTGSWAALFASTPVRSLVVQRVRSARSLADIVPPRSLMRVEVAELSRRVADLLDGCPLLDQAVEIVLPLTTLPNESRRQLRSRFGRRLLGSDRFD